MTLLGARARSLGRYEGSKSALLSRVDQLGNAAARSKPCHGTAMRVVIDALSFLMVGLILGLVAYVGIRWPFADLTQGELRCERAGAVVIRMVWLNRSGQM